MKKILILSSTLIIIISLTILSICLIKNSSIRITKKMLEEETEMESAWDFRLNLNAGWNLGMCLSANINYPDVIQYKVVVDDEVSGLYETKSQNQFILSKSSNSEIKIEFAIPYTSLDGILYWSLDELKLDDQILYQNQSFESEVIDGKLIVSLENKDDVNYNNISVNLHINKFYEYNTVEKLNFYETFWCSTVTTKELIETLKNKGFNAIRISVDVYNHLDMNNVIDDLWINRLKEIVDYCMELDIYCLVDIIETYGLFADNLTEESIGLFQKLWIQVANVFKDYGDNLIFSPFNEIKESNLTYITFDQLTDNMNYLYQVFVNTIRATGGNNSHRNLMLTTFAATANNEYLQSFQLPTDTTYNHLLAECHVYDPVRFTFNEINLGSNDFVYEWGSKEDKKQLDEIFSCLNKFVKRTKVPMIIGEFGAVRRTTLSERLEYFEYFKKKADKYKMGLVMFDDSVAFVTINRKTYEFVDEEIIDLIVSKK